MRGKGCGGGEVDDFKYNVLPSLAIIRLTIAHLNKIYKQGHPNAGI